MDASGAMLEEYSYDPWGRRRSPEDWLTTDVTAPGITTRGYTGHEHLDAFGLIHMNGRIYDPHVGRILNPDPIIQEPLNIQNYNRYSYCLNNPLKYTDPSGYWNDDNCGLKRKNPNWWSGFKDHARDLFGRIKQTLDLNGGGGGTGYSGGNEAFTYIPGVYTAYSVPYISSMSGFGGGSGRTGSVSYGAGVSEKVQQLENPQSQQYNIFNVKDYDGIKGFTVSYYKNDRYPGQAVLNLSYSAAGNNGVKWKQWYKEINFSDMSITSGWDGDNIPYYYTDTDMLIHTHENTVDFYDRPWRPTAGSYEFTLFLYHPDLGNLLEIYWGLTRYSNGNTILAPLKVIKY
jgi:RHS repeat-associated protein